MAGDDDDIFEVSNVADDGDTGKAVSPFDATQARLGKDGILEPLANAFIKHGSWPEAAKELGITTPEALALVAKYPIIGHLVRNANNGEPMDIYGFSIPKKDERLHRINMIAIDPFTSPETKLKAEAQLNKMMDTPPTTKVEVKHSMAELYAQVSGAQDIHKIKDADVTKIETETEEDDDIFS